MRNTYVLLLILGLTVPASFTGCVERKMTVKSSPPNADVYLSYTRRGKTPVTVPFQHYGARDVRLEKSGYHSKQTTLDPVTPVYSYFPLNFFAEVLIPFTIVDHQTFRFELEPYRLPSARRDQPTSDPSDNRRESVLERAREMRKSLPSEQQTPDGGDND